MWVYVRVRVRVCMGAGRTVVEQRRHENEEILGQSVLALGHLAQEVDNVDGDVGVLVRKQPE